MGRQHIRKDSDPSSGFLINGLSLWLEQWPISLLNQDFSKSLFSRKTFQDSGCSDLRIHFLTFMWIQVIRCLCKSCVSLCTWFYYCLFSLVSSRLFSASSICSWKSSFMRWSSGFYSHIFTSSVVDRRLSRSGRSFGSATEILPNGWLQFRWVY